jgi:cation transport ATPase
MSKQTFSSETRSSKSKKLIKSRWSKQQTKKKTDKSNDNNNDNDNRDDDDENAEKFHKLYIVMIFETLSTMNVMLVQIIFWILNNACFQHNIRKKSTFISYTIFNKSIYVMKQETIRVICKIDNKRTNIFFFDAFYISKCSLNLINFDQLN